MKVVVKKFGGTSLGDITRIRNVAKLVADFQRKNPDTKVVVVASAMAGETNRLLALAKTCVAEPAIRELDVLLATGEQCSVALLAMALNELGLSAKSLLASQAKIITDQRYTNAQIVGIESAAVEEVLKASAIPVVAGFQGVNAVGDLTTLGRGGSDITAVALAAALRAVCYIYTDVEGVYSTDPKICPEARLLSQVSHEEMLELASLGAKVLHPRSVFFAMRYKVPLVVLSTFKPGSGTWIVSEEELMEEPLVTAITQRSDEAKITVLELPGGTRSLQQIFNSLAQDGIELDMITQTGVFRNTTNISFTVPDELSSRALELMQRAVPELGAQGAYVSRDIAKISVVGAGMRKHGKVAAQVFEVLAREGIEVEMISTSEIKLSLLIPRKYGEVAVRALHEALIGELKCAA